MQIIRLNGTEKKLYDLVAHLVMNPKVLKQNNNYPFRTSEKFVWYLALKNDEVIGFIPLECKKFECVVNNYYVKDENTDVLRALLDEVIASTSDKLLSAIVIITHHEVFKEAGFVDEKMWTRYVKMRRDHERTN